MTTGRINQVAFTSPWLMGRRGTSQVNRPTQLRNHPLTFQSPEWATVMVEPVTELGGVQALKRRSVQVVSHF